jgi:hypothetical protein
MYSEGIGNPLTNSSKSVGNFSKCHIFVIWIPIPSDHLPEGIDYYLLEHLDEKCFIKNKSGTFWNISEEPKRLSGNYTERFKNHGRIISFFSFYPVISPVAPLNLVRQSL